MTSILTRASSNFLKRHKTQLVLSIFGVALGVTVVVSVELAKNSAMGAFDQAVRAVAGRATHRIIGGPTGLSEEVYTYLRLSGDTGPLAPKVEGLAKFGNEAGTTLRILGVDPLAERAFQSDWYRSTITSQRVNGIDPRRLMTDATAVIATQDTARRLGIEKQESFNVMIGAQRKQISLSGILTPRYSAVTQALGDLLIADIATAQELLGMVGRISYIDLIVDDGLHNTEKLKNIKALLPNDAELIVQGSGQRSVREMTRAFYTNLTALSALSVLVGMFLIYNTMTFLVVQRRELIGGLRALGVTRQQIFRLVLFEAALIGLIGTLVGILIGIALSHIFLELIAKTLNQTFFFLTSPRLSLSPLILAGGALLGIGATMASGLLPAIEASRYSPLQTMRRSHLESRKRAVLIRNALGGFLTLSCAIVIICLPSKNLSLGFIGLLFLIIGFVLLAPILTVFMMAVIRPILARSFGVIGYLPARLVTASLSRTGVAISALMVAIATGIALQLMVGSFRLSVLHWLDERLDGELYVSSPAPAATANASGLSAALVRRIAKLPGVKAVSTVYRVSITKNGAVTRVNAYEMAPVTYSGFRFTEGSPDQVWKAFEHDDSVIVTETYAYLHNVQVGNNVILRTERGDRIFRVIGVYTDYNSGRGIVSMSRRTFDRHWREKGYSGIWIYTREGANLENLRAAIQAISGPGRTLRITLQKQLIDLSKDIFDQAFAITEALRWLPVTIAFAGVFGALMALVLERTREFGILRANGVTPRQLSAIIFAETGLMGFIAGVLALPLSCCLAWVLIFVINRRSFGWSMDFVVDPAVLAQGLGLAILAALLAGLYPANKISKLQPAEALRAE